MQGAWKRLVLMPLLAVPAAAVPPSPQPFRDHCSVCHGDAGEGMVGPTIRPLAITPADARMVVREGRGQMPPIAPRQLSDGALDAILSFLTGAR